LADPVLRDRLVINDSAKMNLRGVPGKWGAGVVTQSAWRLFNDMYFQSKFSFPEHPQYSMVNTEVDDTPSA